MGDRSAISWTDSTWNPVTGCTKVSPGCDHCYIDRCPPFRMEGRRFNGDGPGATTGVRLHPDRLDQPLRWQRPRRVFVNSLADLFHDDVPLEFIVGVWAVMALSGHHTFQVLTKRPARMRAVLSRPDFALLVSAQCLPLLKVRAGEHLEVPLDVTLPLPNVWIGVSVEDQPRADMRIPLLLSTPAAVRFLSCEPLLGPVDVDYAGLLASSQSGSLTIPRVDWVICGGESGPGARPMHPDWARSLRDQCHAAGVPFLFKQWGEWRWTREAVDRDDEREVGDQFPAAKWQVITRDGRVDESNIPSEGSTVMQRVGVKRADRKLDGQLHDSYPDEPRQGAPRRSR